MTDLTLQIILLSLWSVALVGSGTAALFAKDDWPQAVSAISFAVIVWSLPKLTMTVWP